MKLKLITAAVCAVLAGSIMAGTASAKTLKGTVVHTNKSAHSFVIARHHGHLTEVHARHLPKVGKKVKVHARRLRNGTFGARHIKVTGHHRHRIKVRGVVTYSDPAHHKFVVSFRGGSIVVHRRVRRRLHAVLSAHTIIAPSTTTVPSTGTDVTVDGSVDKQGTIEASGVSEHSQVTGNIELEGKVLTVDPTTNTLTISADDCEDLSSASITVTMPSPTFNINNYQVGDMLQIVATLNPDGVTYTAVGTSQDGNQSQANGSSDQQGQDGSGDNNSGDSSSSSTTTSSTDQQSTSSSDN